MDILRQSTGSESEEKSTEPEKRGKKCVSNSMVDETPDDNHNSKIETEGTESESPVELCDGYCQDCDWVNLDNCESVDEKLKELEPILYDSFKTQSECCRKLLKKKEMLLILVLELQEVRRRIAFDRTVMSAVKAEKTRLRREYKHLKHQEIKEKERRVEKHEGDLFKDYQALQSSSEAEDFLVKVVKKRKTLQNLEALVQHKMSNFKKDEGKSLKRKKGSKSTSKKVKSSSPSKSTTRERNIDTSSLSIGAQNMTSNNATAQLNILSNTEERLERLRLRLRDVLAQHAAEMEFGPFLETPF